MTTLSKNTPRSYELGDENDVPAVASDIIYEGAAVGDNGSGYGRPLTAGDPFRGFSIEKVDNSAGAAGAKNIRVKERGAVQLAVASLAITDVGKDVYASDDNTFVLTEGSNTRIGYVKRFVSSGVGVVRFDAAHGLAQEVELTDSSGGTSADTIAAIGATYDQAEVRNAIASLAAKVNSIIRAFGN